MKPFTIGIAGLGTVGIGTLKLLSANSKLISARAGKPIRVKAVSARDKNKNRGLDLNGIQWVDDPLALAKDPEIDAVVELIGGGEGVAKELALTALNNRKSVITANKALIAAHGKELAEIAEFKGASLAFEAAVAGCLPVIRAIRDGLGANRIHRVMGILNGTCNFILTSMQSEGKEFSVVLKEAQDAGFAEANPSLDIDGYDTGHKIAILATLAYGGFLPVDGFSIEGIRDVTLRDIRHAEYLGYSVKLLGMAHWSAEGIDLRVHPALVPLRSSLGEVDGVNNAVLVEGDASGRVLFEGRGAGEGPTASAVVADIMEAARGSHYAPFTLPVKEMKQHKVISFADRRCANYVRVRVEDKPGVLAAITKIFGEQEVSLATVLQPPHAPGEPAEILLTTHPAREGSVAAALQTIATLDSVREPPHRIRIETL